MAARVIGPLPREHGAWAMLAVPWIVGVAVAGTVTVRAALVIVGALALFLAQHRLTEWYRGRRTRAARRASPAAAAGSLAFLTAVGLLALAPALIALPPAIVATLIVAAIAATAASLALVDARVDHALPGQALAAVALALTGPTAYLAAGGTSVRVALALWGLNAAFFLWAVLYVNVLIQARARRPPLARLADRVRFAAPTLAADVALAVLVATTLGFGGLSGRALAAFAPAAVQTIVGTASLHRPAPLKRVGILMLAHSIVFAVLFGLLA